MIAHRGASAYAPENTIPAILLAWELNADGIEIDVHPTADGRIAVIHDDDTKRVSGVNLKVADTDFSELSKLDVGSWMDHKWKDARIPSLEEVLALLPDDKLIQIEIKNSGNQTASLRRIVNESGKSRKHIMFISFIPEAVASIKKILPECPSCLLCGTSHGENGKVKEPDLDNLLQTVKTDGLDGLDIHYQLLLDHPDWTKKIKSEGLALFTWTVNDVNAAVSLARQGVDGIITNFPDRIIKALRPSI